MNFIDKFLNNITMYRLVMHYLIVLLAIATLFGAIVFPHDLFVLHHVGNAE